MINWTHTIPERIVDTYDTPRLEAYVNGCWSEMTALIRSLFNSTFKTNPYMERTLMTGTARPALSGVTRVSKESIFSDLNNLEVIISVIMVLPLRGKGF